MSAFIAKHLYDQRVQDQLLRLTRFRKAWEYYYGQIPLPLKVRKGQPDDNVRFNYARLIVDKGVAFLFGSPISFTIKYPEVDKEGYDDPDADTGDGTAKDPNQQWLEDAWAYNKQDLLLQKVGQQGGVSGQVFVKIIEQPGNYPRLVNLDPAYVKVDCDSDDYEDVFRFTICYNSFARDTGRATLVTQTIERSEDKRFWTIVDKVEDVESKAILKESEPVIWNYPIAPIASAQNLIDANSFWGMSDIEDDVLAVNNTLNFIATNTNRIIRFHAHPKTWGKGFVASQLEIAVDEMLIINSPDGTLGNLEMTSDLSASLSFYDRVKKALHDVSQIPEVALGSAGEISGDVSGVALEILYQQLVEKTKKKRMTYGSLLDHINVAMLMLNGVQIKQVPITWPPMLPIDALAYRQALKIDHELGVSAETILEKLDYDVAVEKQKRSIENEENMRQAQEAAKNAAIANGNDPNANGANNQEPATAPAPAKAKEADTSKEVN